MDRLLAFSVVELRGCERFRLASEVMPDDELRLFYLDLFECEARHHGTYLELARQYFGRTAADARLGEILDAEATIVAGLPIQSALH